MSYVPGLKKKLFQFNTNHSTPYGVEFTIRRIKMKNKIVTGDCLSCESTYSVEFVEELTSEELPEFCPFCGEPIEELSEEYIEDDDLDEKDLEWE